MQTSASGKSLPARYVGSVSNLVSKLRESLEADQSQAASKFREKAEAAKDAIRQYLQQWRGKGTPGAEAVDSAVESALRELSSFYSKNGPQAIMSADSKAVILELLARAEAAL